MKQLVCLITFLLFNGLMAFPLPAQKIFYDYRDAAGEWRTAEVANRVALVAENRDQEGYIDIEIPQEGKYKIFAILMHNWDKAWPVIETRIVQNGQIVDTGYFMTEPDELSHLNQGRWLIKSTDTGKSVALKKGTARLHFRLNSLNSIRKKVAVDVEGKLYLWSFLVVPATEDGTVMNLLEAERITGDWDKVEFNREDQCGTIESVTGVPARFRVTVPTSGSYQLGALLRDSGKTNLRLRFIGYGMEQWRQKEVVLEQDGLWRYQPFLTTYFERGEYVVEIENSSSKNIWVDSFILVPHSESPTPKQKLSCSTVYFYHNNGTTDLSDGVGKIVGAGFKSVDIVAYDGKYGFGNDVTEKEIVALKEKLAKLGAQAASVHFGHVPLRTEEEAVDRLQWAIWVAGIMDAPRIVAPVSLDIEGDQGIYLSKEKGFQRLAQVIQRIKPQLEEAGLELGFENHGHRQWLFQGIEDYLSARNVLSKNVTFVLDEGHFEHFGDDPNSAFRRLLPYSRYVHFKSKDKEHIMSLTDTLRQLEYWGDISLEVETGGDSLEDWFTLYDSIIQ